ncbi:hypothetical protein PUMCH_002650 [Australozyma saopauloensis]|uniref:Prephenate dehydratase n=1 Tax=Australozyma saopauloensis TaxID=291208 RepID=A0AAX4HAA0_9ASCO|nr:hypothetical protein PUMCH_002650 [[Candida] saopauloensis]
MNSNETVKKWTRVDTQSTAQAAEIVAKDTSNTSACISSILSSELYELPILVPNVEDKKENTTRFLVLAQNASSSPSRVEGQHYITSLMFVLGHNDPGALCQALDLFRRNNVNLHSIASRPSGRAQWEYVFFVEIEGHSSDDAVTQSLRELKSNCSQTATLGLFSREQ